MSTLATRPPDPAQAILSGVSWTQHHVEELVSLVSSWGLVAAQVIAGLVIMSDGAFSLALPSLDWLWVACQVGGIDVQIMITLARATRAHHEQRWGAMLAWGLASLPVLLITVFMSWVYSMMRAQNVTEATALTTTHIPAPAWLFFRVCVGVFIIAVSLVARMAHTTPAVALPPLPPTAPEIPPTKRLDVQTERPTRDMDAEAKTRALAKAWIRENRAATGRYPSAQRTATAFGVSKATGGAWVSQVRSEVEGSRVA